MSSLWLLILLLSAVEGKNLQKEDPKDDKDDRDDGSADSEQGYLGNMSHNNTQGAQQRSEPTEMEWQQRVTDFRSWAADVRKQKVGLVATFGNEIGTTDKEDMKKKFDELADTIGKQTKESIGKTLDEVKNRVDKNGARATPNSQQSLNRIKATTQVFMDNGPALVKNIKAKDGWATAATVCTMISGVAAIVPHPIGIITSMVFGVAAFFLNLGAKKTVVQAKEDPYTKIYEKIDEAVIKINAHNRKIALSRQLSGLPLAQRVSETVLNLSNERLTLKEFKLWSMTNNFPSMTCFVQTLADIRGYITMLKEDLAGDQTIQDLQMVYAKICILRDIVLSALDVLFPSKPHDPTQISSDPVDYPEIVRLRKEYQKSLNKQKQGTFEYLMTQFHKPTPETLKYISWYYPPDRPEGDASILFAYLRGLSYVDEEAGVHLMPPTTINPELLKVIKCTITSTVINKNYDPLKCPLLPTYKESTDITGDSSSGKGVLAMVLKDLRYNKNQARPKSYFTFNPVDGYVEITYGDPDRMTDHESYGWFKKFDHRVLNVYDDRLHIMGQEEFRKTHSQTNKLTLVPILEQTTNLNTFRVMLGNANDDSKYLTFDKWHNFNGDYGLIKFVTVTPTHTTGTADKPDPTKKTLGALILDLKLKETAPGPTSTLADVKAALIGKYKELGDGPDSIVNMGANLHTINDALHFCQLLGKCKRAN